MPPAVVADATCIIALHRIGRIDILKAVFGSVSIPPAIEREIYNIKADWIVVEEVHRTQVAHGLGVFLDRGESEAIALASDKQDALFNP